MDFRNIHAKILVFTLRPNASCILRWPLRTLLLQTHPSHSDTWDVLFETSVWTSGKPMVSGSYQYFSIILHQNSYSIGESWYPIISNEKRKKFQSHLKAASWCKKCLFKIAFHVIWNGVSDVEVAQRTPNALIGVSPSHPKFYVMLATSSRKHLNKPRTARQIRLKIRC